MIARRRPGRIKRFFKRIGEFFGDVVEGAFDD